MVDNFTEKLRRIFAASDGMKISSTTKSTELRISGKVDSVTVDDACVMQSSFLLEVVVRVFPQRAEHTPPSMA